MSENNRKKEWERLKGDPRMPKVLEDEFGKQPTPKEPVDPKVEEKPKEPLPGQRKKK